MKDVFIELIQKYTVNTQQAEQFWQEIETHYTHKKRHYHTLEHLENIYQQLLPIKGAIKDWDTLLFALFYHDIIYKASRKDNEEKSAQLAAERLIEIGYDKAKIELCITHILTTKRHEFSYDSDVNYFTDADLSILGADGDTYAKYARNVRKEYAIYPDFLYYPGRKKALAHFLEMDFIFKTEEFRNRFEKQARRNINVELK